MPGIYENIMEAERLLDECYELETGEIDEAKEAELLALKEQIINEGLESLCNLRADKLAYIAGLDGEASRITDKVKAEKKKLASLEDFILLIHRKSGKDKSIAGSWTVGIRKSVQVKIIDPDFNDPRFFITKQTSQLDKMKLKDALKNGEEIPGAELVTNYNLNVK